MPRTPTIEANYVQLTATPANITNVAALIPGLAAIGYEVENPAEVFLARFYAPQMTVSSLNATVTFNIQDVTGAAQTLQTTICEGITAAGNFGAVLCEARFQPQNLTVTPTLAGPRLLGINAVTSAGTATLTAAATGPIFLQILNLNRQ
jgi:hypothetical protein